MKRGRSRVAVITIAALMLASIGAAWAFQGSTRPARKPWPFSGTQWVTVQIVTAPTRIPIPPPGGGAGSLVYEEASTVIHATHRFPVSASGAGQSILSVNGELPLEIAFKGAHPAKDGSGIVLADLQFVLPIKFRTSATASEHSLMFFPADTTVTRDFHDFHRQLSIDYRGESLLNTFIRMRFTDAAEPLPVIDLTALGASQ